MLDTLTLLKQLISAPGPPGQEDQVAQVVDRAGETVVVAAQVIAQVVVPVVDQAVAELALLLKDNFS